ncbi:DUF4395 family protein [Deinococcus sp.]|uniref:DUF4395 family protein n=1 Tax=Deinococcus sp. TaxID=47478 RepID=UPI0025F51B09|nr:DUF4395 family protein [Deinococcus sp.]
MRTDLSAIKFNQLSVVAVTALSLAFQAPWLALLLGAAMSLGALIPAHCPMRAAYRLLSPLLRLRPEVDQYSELRHGENSLPAPPFCALLSQHYSLRSVIKRVFL